ncbi:MAG: hypothetical protein FWD83_07395 [Promicromonosporaceae bacterium]|nr:hypothetical protein [Promicromonosporaceae bacterium]
MTISIEPPAVSTRDLKQNPAQVVQRVLELGDHVITAHGHPTGVRVVRDEGGPQQWISGTALNQAALPGISDVSRRDMHVQRNTPADNPTSTWSAAQ